MTIRELADLIGAKIETKTVNTGREVLCGYACDLLSWVMARGKEGMAWITVQAHMNAVAVAVLSDMSCVVAAEGVKFDAAVIQKAEEEGVALLETAKSAYEAAGLLYEAGVR
ncbi:MAG: AraC family transcriptional regulator [Clostridiales bacterium]|nr:AraC family transcriptional regulator [Clostridiales bacterium]